MAERVPSRDGRRAIVYGIVVTISLVSCFLVVWKSGWTCDRAPKVVLLKVPDGFRGKITIRCRSDGIDGSWQGDEYHVVVPASGDVFVESFGPFQQFHCLVGRWSNGDAIPVNPQDPTLVGIAGGDLSQYLNGPEPDGEVITYYVGTAGGRSQTITP
jgi:hypothetical protein